MKNILHIGLGLMVLLLLVAGCGRKVVPSTTTIVHDSIYVKEVTRFVEVKIPGDTVEVLKWIECDSNTNKPKPFILSKKSKTASVKVEVRETGELHVTGVCDELIKQLEAKDREINRQRSESKSQTKIIEVHDPYWFDIAARWIAVIAVLTVVGYTLFKINKPI